MIESVYGLERYDQLRQISASASPRLSGCISVMRWLEDQVMGTHPTQGYRHVCPGLPESIRRMALWIGPAEFDSVLEVALGQLLEWGQRFWGIPPMDIPSANHKALILVMPDSADRDQAQRMKNLAKLAFVQNGLMVGTFNPEQRDARFDPVTNWPPRSPAPVFAIRQIIKSDFRFLSYDKRTNAEYLARFGPIL